MPVVISEKKRKKYALTRIKGVEQTGAHFKPVRKFDIKVELGTGIGAHNEEETHEVRVRFDAEVATYILERKWHYTAVKPQNADGTVEVRMQVCPSPEVDLLLLPWAEYLEVLSPPELQITSVRPRPSLGRGIRSGRRRIAPVSRTKYLDYAVCDGSSLPVACSAWLPTISFVDHSGVSFCDHNAEHVVTEASAHYVFDFKLQSFICAVLPITP